MSYRRSQPSDRNTPSPWTGRLTPMVSAILLGATAMFACADDEPAAPSEQINESAMVSASPAITSGAVVESDPALEVQARFDEVVAAHEADDHNRLAELSSGPARVFAERVRHFATAVGLTEPYPNVHSRTGDVSISDDGVATLDGLIAWGPDEASVREMTSFEFRHDGEQWLLHSYERTGIPIGRWVAPGSGSPVTSGPITVELVSMFTDLACAVDAETDCLDELRNIISLDLAVHNDSDGELEPGMLSLPDGTESPAWLETPSGGVHPLTGAEVMGFPPRATAAVVGLFAAVDDLADGAVLHIVLSDADGVAHEVDVPVPAYPHDWSTDS